MTQEQFHQCIGLRIRKARRAADVTQGQLAEQLGFKSASYICEVEQGDRTLPIYSLYQIECILGVSIWEPKVNQP